MARSIDDQCVDARFSYNASIDESFGAFYSRHIQRCALHFHDHATSNVIAVWFRLERVWPVVCAIHFFREFLPQRRIPCCNIVLLLREQISSRESRLNSKTSCITYVLHFICGLCFYVVLPGHLNIFINILYCTAALRSYIFETKSASVRQINSYLSCYVGYVIAFLISKLVFSSSYRFSH